MKDYRFFSVIRECLGKNRLALIFFAVITAVNFAVFKLYRLDSEPYLYSEAILLFSAVVLLCFDFVSDVKKASEREHLKKSVLSEWREGISYPTTLCEKDFCEMLQALGAEVERLGDEFEEERRDMLDYYTAWVHQIKTPIAVMKLNLTKENDFDGAIAAELFRIEQYVDMVLSFIRLGSESNDLVIKEYTLDDIIREAVRKYASLFIYKKVKLEYGGTDAKIITDKKWFSVILEQYISNAVKYTPSGGAVKIQADSEILSVSDSGIGIAPEDIPRIFEKGYTGYNGRIGRKSSGLGLYLASGAAKKLAVSLSVESNVGEGSIFSIHYRKTE